MRGPAGSVLVRRMNYARLLLAEVVLTTLIAAAVLSALTAFAVQLLPQAAQRQLTHAPGMSLVVIGLVSASTAQSDTNAIGTQARSVLDGVPYQLDETIWSDPLVLTAPDGQTNSNAEVAASGQIEANAALTAGSWPGAVRAGRPVPVALPTAVASQLHAGLGAVLAVRDGNTGRQQRLLVSGVYRQRNPQAAYWGSDAIWTCSARSAGCITAAGPIVAAIGSFGEGTGTGGFAVDQASWVVAPDMARISLGALTGLAARIQGTENLLLHSQGLFASSAMPPVLLGTAADLITAKSLIVIVSLLLLLPAGCALVLGARLLASHREEEYSLLTARGADRWQLALPTLTEAVLAALAAALAGAFAGVWLAGLLAKTSLLHSSGLHTSGIPLDVQLLALAIMALCAAVVAWPTLRPPARNRNRPRPRAAAIEAGGDIALVVLAVAAVWQLHTYADVPFARPGGTGIDPVIAVAPALALAGVSLIPLRLIPLMTAGLDRLAAGTRHLGTALASWEISRRPVRQAGPVLLTVLAVATGTLALAQYHTWRQSVQDQAAFSVGSDARVDTPPPAAVALGDVTALTRMRGVSSSMPLTNVPLASGSDLMVVDAATAQATLIMRPDLFAGISSAALWRMITPATQAGLVLPGRPARLEVTVRLPGAQSGKAQSGKAQSGATQRGRGRGTPPVLTSVDLLIQDSTGVVYSLPAGDLALDGQNHQLIAVLSATRQASYPLRLMGIVEQPSAGQSQTTSVPPPEVTGISASAAMTGPFDAPFASASSLRTWKSDVSTDSGITSLTAPPPTRVIPGIATSAFLAANDARVGDVFDVQPYADRFPVEIVASVAAFPTVSGPGGALIVDQAAMQDALLSEQNPILPVTSWLLRTGTGTLPPGLMRPAPDAASPPAGATVTDRTAQAAALQDNPLAAAPQLVALAVAVAAALLAVVGFAAGIAASLQERRRRSALLAALGVPPAAQARQLCLEELVLGLPAAAVGVLAGLGLAHLLVPSVIRTPTDAAPIPPVLVVVPASWIIALALAVTAVPVLVAAASVARRPDAAAELRGVETA
jgi:FtsX-like permease family